MEIKYLTKISIIVPIYKVEMYLEKCIDSILNQTFKEFEVILVEDGSPDNCGEICDYYAEKDNRIKVIHKENGGLSSARNAGIEIAQGEYIAFVDSDDFIDKNMYKLLYNNAIKYEADISICKFKYICDNNISLECSKYETKVEEFSNIEGLNQLYTDRNVEFVVAWNKLYKKELFKNLRYEYGKVHEDEFIIHELLYRSNKIIYIPIELYYYLQREGSIMKSEFNIRNFDKIYALIKRMEFFREKKLDKLEFKAQKIYAITFLKYYYKAKFNLYNSTYYLNDVRRDFKIILKYILKNPYCNIKEKILLIAFAINPKVYELYFKIKGKELI